MINCSCGSVVSKHSLNRHKGTKKHIDFMKSQASNDEKKVEVKEQEVDEEEEEEKGEIPVKSNIQNTIQEVESEEESEEEESEEEVVEVKDKPVSKRTTNSKAHMDAIREKAIMKLKEKKQMKIEKENELRTKAEQYDILVKSLQEKEEKEKKQKEIDRLKEMEYKSSQYDKMVKQQERNSAISSLSNKKIIDDIKEQRIAYLMKYLQNPSQY